MAVTARFRTTARGLCFVTLFLVLSSCGLIRQLGVTEEPEIAAVRPAPRPAMVKDHAHPLTDTIFEVYLTAYSYWDNTPPQSAAIARPVLHDQAGGVGTFEDPITIAVGHQIEGGAQVLDYPPGTRFYFPRLRKYAMVEDVCGDGERPQAGPCHTGFAGLPWLDIYIGGEAANPEMAELCASRITAVQPVLMNPEAEHLVEQGAILETICAEPAAEDRLADFRILRYPGNGTTITAMHPITSHY